MCMCVYVCVCVCVRARARVCVYVCGQNPADKMVVQTLPSTYLLLYDRVLTSAACRVLNFSSVDLVIPVVHISGEV